MVENNKMVSPSAYISPFAGKTPEYNYIAYIDILGFGNKVINNFESTIKVYEDLIGCYSRLNCLVNMRIFSDSIILQSLRLFDVAYLASVIQFVAFERGYLVRGGIADGKHLESGQNGNIYLVSQALVKAVEQEKDNQKKNIPCITLQEDIEPVPAMVLNDPARIVVEYRGRNIINPFNPGKESGNRDEILSRLFELSRQCEKPHDKQKYYWLMEFAHDVLSK